MTQKEKDCMERKLTRARIIGRTSCIIGIVLILSRLILPMVMEEVPFLLDKYLLLSSLVFVAIAFVASKIHTNIMIDLLDLLT